MNLYDNLYYTSNYKSLCEDKIEKAKESNLNLKNNLISKDIDEDRNYKYFDYDELVDELVSLSKEHSRFLKLETGQKLYNLPHPGGTCGKAKTKCSHYIAFLTDHDLNSTSKTQIYISGEVHGNEKVGPNASLELIKLLLKHKDSDPWIKHLLATRLIVITPMTNPYGYSSDQRQETLESIEMPEQSLDINRDFPYLVENTKCMLTIGARLVNELFISHIFSLSLSLHGGTESLTYPYGSPNHIKNNKTEIPLKYTTITNNLTGAKNLIIETFPDTSFIVDEYKKGEISHVSGESTESPDFLAMSSIAHSANYNGAGENSLYKEGDISNVVYPVTGGMEDWAYAGSWEGSPVITQSCIPNTYGGYDKSKTIYSEKHKDALKSVMFLFEISLEKTPSREMLGERSSNDECILNIRENPFSILNSNSILNNTTNTNVNQLSTDIVKRRERCLDRTKDGYINKVLRLSLSLIDLLEPYINVSFKFDNENNKVNVDWVVGGAIKVDETFILFHFTTELSKSKSKSKSEMSYSEIINMFKNKSSVMSGRALWDREFNRNKNDVFKNSIDIIQGNQTNQVREEYIYIEFIVLAKVDKDWLKQNNPSPKVYPQTHIVNLRNNKDYTASNEKYLLQGQEYFKSEVFSITIKNKNIKLIK